MNYTSKNAEQMAWNLFAVDDRMAKKYTEQQMQDLHDALDSYCKHQPSPEKVKGWVAQFGHEEVRYIKKLLYQRVSDR